MLYVATVYPAPLVFTDAQQVANLYTGSLVVLDARTGKLVWHHQATPHDFHDWDLTQVSPLFRADVDGKPGDFVSVVGKEGLLRILDRESRAQVTAVAVTRRHNVEAPVTQEGVYACPGPLGGVQWNGPAYSPRTNMLYVASVEWCGTFKKAETLAHVPGQNYMGGSFRPDPMEQSRGWLTAVDASTGAVRWRYESPRPMLAAVTVTSADLVFTGELGGDFLVLDARDGTVVFRYHIGSAMGGGIVTYQVAGKQYVAVMSGTARRCVRRPPAPATVTIFGVPTP